MKIICAGYPKTGTKTCSTALRQLGYKVADYLETTEYLSHIWLKYLEGNASIEQVLEEYKKYGFDANQDGPGNFKWEELYRASPSGTKVILTIRDSEDQWWSSWCKFVEQETRRGAIGDFSCHSLLQYLMKIGYFGPQWQNQIKAMIEAMKQQDFPPIFDGKFFISKHLKTITNGEQSLKQNYRKHNSYVASVVPKEDLLVWNVKVNILILISSLLLILRMDGNHFAIF